MRINLLVLLACGTAVVAISGCSRPNDDGSSPHGGAPANPGAGTGASAVRPALSTGPKLTLTTGQYFSYKMPDKWSALEVADGISMTSDDGTLKAGSRFVSTGVAQDDPWSFLADQLNEQMARDVKRISSVDLPSKPSPTAGVKWQIQNLEVTFTDVDGSRKHGDFTCAIYRNTPLNVGMLQYFIAPDSEYNKVKTWLPELLKSVTARDPARTNLKNGLF